MNNGNFNRRKTDSNIPDFNVNDENVEMSNYNEDSNQILNRRNSDKPNKNTLINLNSGKPIGLDLDSFMNDGVSEHTVHSISQSNDLPIISEVNEQHQSFKGITSKRLNCLKMISNCWSSNNYSSAFNAINLMKDASVSNDFFYYCFVKNDISKIPLTMDNVITIMPHVAGLINSKYDPYVKNGVRAASNILNNFNERIISVKNVIVTNGVDLAREERLKKCDVIIEQYESILTSHNLARIISKQNNDEVF